MFAVLLFAVGATIWGLAALIVPSRAGFYSGFTLGIAATIILVALDVNLGPTNWHSIARREAYPSTDASKLKRTIVSPHSHVPISPGTNVLWCGTFQLAWNELCELTGGDVQFQKTDPFSQILNERALTKDSLTPSSYLAIAGQSRSGIHQRIQDEVQRRFHGEFKPPFLPPEEAARRPQDVVAYACLFQLLKFPVPYERLDEMHTFNNTRVPAFGITRYRPSREALYSQILILDYLDETDFIIELRTESDSERLILAKVQAGPTLDATLRTVQERMTGKIPERASTNDVLVIPRIRMNITRQFTEIEGLLLIPKSSLMPRDLILQSAIQNTRFEMNERGVELRSESHMAFGCAGPPIVPRTRQMVFDRPFLVILQKRGATVPYFALWIDNPEVLVTWK